MLVLHVACQPAQLAAEEFRQRRRVRLPRAVFVRQHTHAPAGAAQHGCLDLVVRQDVPAAGQRRQPAVRAEWRDADHRVVPPIGAFVALPPRLPGRPGPHSRPHAELEQPRERGRGRQSDGQVLRDRQRRVRLHGAHQTQHRGRRHLRIGVERQHQLEPVGVVIEEVHDVAGLEAGVRGAPAVVDARGVAILGAEARNRLVFGGRRAVRVSDRMNRANASPHSSRSRSCSSRRNGCSTSRISSFAHRHGDRRSRQRLRSRSRQRRETPRGPGRARTPARGSRSARWPDTGRSTTRCRRRPTSIASLGRVQPPGAST